MKIKLGISVASLLLVSVFIYSYSGGNAQSVIQNQEMLCHIPDVAEKHDHQAIVSYNMATMAHGQDPEQDQEQQPAPNTGHRWSPGDGCSSVNPNAPDKERDGVNPNTVGCKCVRKCVNGQTQEDLSRDEKGVYICSNACHKDRCTCPDPCKH